MPLPNVQWMTPEDRKRNCPKHVEFRTRINLEISASVGFYCIEIFQYFMHFVISSSNGVIRVVITL